MTLGMTADEELEQYDDLDQFDDDPGFNLRGGGTDLFRAVLVLLIAAAVGALILTRGFDGTSNVDEQESAADAVETGDAAADTGAVPAAPAADGDGDAAAGEAMTDDAMADDAMADDATVTTAADATANTDSTASSTDSTDPSTTSTAVSSVARAPGEVEVLVLNATDKKGVAAQASELLQTSSYNTAPAGNATITGMGSVIYYMDGYRADAIAVAQVFTDGLEGLVQAYDPAKPPSDEIGTAKVIVVLGIDEAIPIG